MEKMDIKTTEKEDTRLKTNINDVTYETRIGDKAPMFSAKTTMGDISLKDYAGKWLILFSHPGDFTPVTKRT